MRPGLLRQRGAADADPGGDQELLRLRRDQRHAGDPARALSPPPDAARASRPLSFDHRLSPPRWLRGAVVAFGLAASLAIALGARALAERAGPLAGIAWLGAGAAAVAAGGLRWRRALAREAWLRVDERGAAWLRPGPPEAAADAAPAGAPPAGTAPASASAASTAPADAVPARPVRWLLADGFVALTLDVGDGERPSRCRFLSGPAGRDDDAWRRLRAWLAWRRRGGSADGGDEP